MSQIQKLEGIVIKKSDYKENAALITVLTKEGKLSLIVRGAKKINSVTRNYTNLFTKLDFNATNNLKLKLMLQSLILFSNNPHVVNMQFQSHLNLVLLV